MVIETRAITVITKQCSHCPVIKPSTRHGNYTEILCGVGDDANDEVLNVFLDFTAHGTVNSE